MRTRAGTADGAAWVGVRAGKVDVSPCEGDGAAVRQAISIARVRTMMARRTGVFIRCSIPSIYPARLGFTTGCTIERDFRGQGSGVRLKSPRSAQKKPGFEEKKKPGFELISVFP